MISSIVRDHLRRRPSPPRCGDLGGRRGELVGLARPSRRSGLHGAGELLHRRGGLLQVGSPSARCAGSGPGCRCAISVAGGARCCRSTSRTWPTMRRSDSCIVRQRAQQLAELRRGRCVSMRPRQVAVGDARAPCGRRARSGRHDRRACRPASAGTITAMRQQPTRRAEPSVVAACLAAQLCVGLRRRVDRLRRRRPALGRHRSCLHRRAAAQRVGRRWHRAAGVDAGRRRCEALGRLIACDGRELARRSSRGALGSRRSAALHRRSAVAGALGRAPAATARGGASRRASRSR